MFTLAKRIVPSGAEPEDFADSIDLGSTLVIALADGAGGMGGGAYAARTATRLALSMAKQINPHDEGDWRRVIAELDARLEEDPKAGKTTLVVAAIWDHGITGASVGDSGAWIVDGPIQDLTRAQQRKPLLGSGAALPVPFRPASTIQIASRRISVFRTFLVASDGLFKYADADAICGRAQGDDLHRAAEQLVQGVRLPSGALHDDVALVLCRRAAGNLG